MSLTYRLSCLYQKSRSSYKNHTLIPKITCWMTSSPGSSELLSVIIFVIPAHIRHSIICSCVSFFFSVLHTQVSSGVFLTETRWKCQAFPSWQRNICCSFKETLFHDYVFSGNSGITHISQNSLLSWTCPNMLDRTKSHILFSSSTVLTFPWNLLRSYFAYQQQQV